MHKTLTAACALLAGLSLPAAAQPRPDPQPASAGMEEIVITASPLGESRFEVLQGTAVLAGPAYDRALAASIGDMLDRLPGVAQTGFGQGASRPIIRGQGGDRVRVLLGGIGTIDASTASPDHAPAVDMATARQVEVVRGPATLLYGSNAVGGVVNVLDGRIPTALPRGGVDGLVRLGAGSNAEDWLAAAGLDVALGGRLVLHVDGFRREAGDYEVPGFIESAAFRAQEEAGHDEDEDEDHDHDGDHDHGEEEHARGRVENSDLEQQGLTGGLSLVGNRGFFGASLSRLETAYGIPAGHDHGHGEEHDADEEHDHEEEEEHGHGGVRIDLEQTRLDVMGEIALNMAPVERLRLRFGHADYEHRELEGDEIGTVFANEGWEGRVELVQTPATLAGGRLTGAVGLQAHNRDFSAAGGEAFVPPSETRQFGGFLYQRLDLGRVDLSAGARLEGQRVEADGFGRDFTTVSLSGGMGWRFATGWLAGLSLSRTERAPNAEELLSDGPHLATGTYELGDRGLDSETARSIEVTLKQGDGPLTGALNLFHTAYDGFIQERLTGEEEDGLPVARFTATDAVFWGAELELAAALPLADGHALRLDLVADVVRAEDTDTDTPLPRIPALSVRTGVEYALESLTGRVELAWTDRQARTAAFELPTEGHTVLNAWLEWRPLPTQDLALLLEGRNLTDAEVRLATSFLKDRLPQPGRDIRVLLRAGF